MDLYLKFFVCGLQFAEENKDFDDPESILKHVSDVHDRRFRLRAFCEIIVYGGITSFTPANADPDEDAATASVMPTGEVS